MNIIKEISSMSICEDFNRVAGHSAHLDAYYSKLLTALKTAVLFFMSSGKKTFLKPFVDFNTHCKRKYIKTREALKLVETMR